MVLRGDLRSPFFLLELCTVEAPYSREIRSINIPRIPTIFTDGEVEGTDDLILSSDFFIDRTVDSLPLNERDMDANDSPRPLIRNSCQCNITHNALVLSSISGSALERFASGRSFKAMSTSFLFVLSSGKGALATAEVLAVFASVPSLAFVTVTGFSAMSFSLVPLVPFRKLGIISFLHRVTSMSNPNACVVYLGIGYLLDYDLFWSQTTSF
uniref:Uncharacterized protein n=1 Tax=Glossina pallidipes TaxID=7398 RepID=A0A1A9ZPV3_GLOPL